MPNKTDLRQQSDNDLHDHFINVGPLYILWQDCIKHHDWETIERMAKTLFKYMPEQLAILKNEFLDESLPF